MDNEAAFDLILKRASVHGGPSAALEDYAVLYRGEVVGRIMKDDGIKDRPWFWGLAYGHHRDRHPSHGHEASREAAMAAFRKSWDRA